MDITVEMLQKGINVMQKGEYGSQENYKKITGRVFGCKRK